MVVQLCVIWFDVATHAVYPVLASIKNSFSINLDAKKALKRKLATLVEVSSLLVESILVSQGVDPDAAY